MKLIAQSISIGKQTGRKTRIIDTVYSPTKDRAKNNIRKFTARHARTLSSLCKAFGTCYFHDPKKYLEREQSIRSEAEIVHRQIDMYYILSTPNFIFYWALVLLAIVFWGVRIPLFIGQCIKGKVRVSMTKCGIGVALLCAFFGVLWNTSFTDATTYTVFLALWLTPVIALFYARNIKDTLMRRASMFLLLWLAVPSVYKLCLQIIRCFGIEV